VNNLDCRRCGARLEPGYLVDHGYGAIYPMGWTHGQPKWNKWLGLKVQRKDLLPVRTYRCPKCGLLESYADQGKWPG
jgi:hypothetical protein